MRASVFLLLGLAALLVCVSSATGDFDVDTDETAVIDQNEEPSFDEQTIDLSMTKSGTAMITAIKSMCSNLDNQMHRLTEEAGRCKRKCHAKRSIRKQKADRVATCNRGLDTQRKRDAAARGSLAGIRKQCDADNTRVLKELHIVGILQNKLGKLERIKPEETSDIQAQVASVNDVELSTAATALLESGEERSNETTQSIKGLLKSLRERLERELKTCADNVRSAERAVEEVRAPLAQATSELRTALEEHSAAARISDRATQERTDAEKAVLAATETQTDDRAQCARLKNVLDGGLITCRADSEIKAMAANYKDVSDKLATCAAALKKATTKPKASVGATHAVERFDPHSAQGQLMAQAACVSMNRAGWAFAVKRKCGTSLTCAKICNGITEGQAGGLGCFESLHIYSNQPAAKTPAVGLKVHKYRSCNAASCGPNYCCCKNGRTEEDVEEGPADGELAEGDADEEPEFDVTEDVELDAHAEMDKVRHTFSSAMVYQTEGQLEAQAACVALNSGGAWSFAVYRSSRHTGTCASVCKGLSGKDSQAGKLACFNSLHVYGNSHASSQHTHGLKTYKYNGCGGGWGPNYCCCRGTGAKEEDDEALNENDNGEEEDSDADESALSLLESTHAFEQYGLAGQIQAEAVALTMSTRNGWTYAVKRPCKGSENCNSICGRMSESQAKSAGSPNLRCMNSLHIYGNQPANGQAKIGLKTYRYNSCASSGCGPNYCLCWAGYRNAHPN